MRPGRFSTWAPIRDHEDRMPVDLIGEGVKQYPGIPEVIRQIGAWARPKE